MPYKYRDLMWSEMTDKQKEIAGSKSEHKAAKAAYEESQSTPAPTPTPTPDDPRSSEFKIFRDE